LRRACFVLALALIPLVATPLARAQAIEAHSAGGPASLDGPWLLYEGDPPGGEFPSADPRPGQSYRLATGGTPTQGPNIIWLRATVSSDEQLSDPALLVNPAAEDCQVFVNGQKAVDCSNWPRTSSEAQRWMLVHLPTSPAQIALRIAGSMGSPATIPHRGDVLLGRADVLEEIRTAADATRFYRGLPQTLLCAGELLGGVILLLAFRNDPAGERTCGSSPSFFSMAPCRWSRS
jgi:hypothetical protein